MFSVLRFFYYLWKCSLKNKHPEDVFCTVNPTEQENCKQFYLLTTSLDTLVNQNVGIFFEMALVVATALD